MVRTSAVDRLTKLLSSETVVDLPRIEAALGGVSSMTVFRYLQKVPYRRSYNYNGRYYCLHEPDRYDQLGLWSWKDIHFSVDNSLRSTVKRLVHTSEAGATHRELHGQLRVRVHNTLLDLLRKEEIDRERYAQVYVYLHTDPGLKKEQHRQRQALIADQTIIMADGEIEVSDQVVIQVLLTLLHHPASTAADVVRYLRGHSPPITAMQVRIVFACYELDSIGKKGGALNY